MDPVCELPFGLIICIYNGSQVTVTAVSDKIIKVRLAEPAPVKTIEIRFLDRRAASWRTLVPKDYRLLGMKREAFLCEAEIAINDPAFGTEVNKALKEYAEYIRMKSEYDDDEFAYEAAGLPYPGKTSAYLEKQKHEFFAGCGFDCSRYNYSLALSITDPSAYERFLSMDPADFKRDLLTRGGFENHALFARDAVRIYIGNPCCARLMPRDVGVLASRAAACGLAVTFVLPPVREDRMDDVLEIVSEIEKTDADEIEVNDMGMLYALRDCSKKRILGIQLNRRRKDPRIKYKAGFETNTRLLAENNLNDPGFRELLAKLGVTRYEYESACLPAVPTPGKHSLHLPFFQTNTSHGCPLAAACLGIDPGRPFDERTCSMPCLDKALLYADDRQMAGRYNSIFGADTEILNEPAVLEKWLNGGIDRIVAEAL